MEVGHCLLTRDSHCGECELLQTYRVNVQLEDWSSNHIHLFFAAESLLDHSEGPESCDQDTLPRKKTKRLMSADFRDGKSESFGKSPRSPFLVFPSSRYLLTSFG